MSDTDDLPMISPPSDSTQIELSPQKEVRVNAPEPRRHQTTRVISKPADTAVPAEHAAAKPAPRPAAPAAPVPAPRPPILAPKPSAPAGDAASASRPVAPVVKAPVPPAGGEDEDPEKLLREYAERQKTKLVRLEQQLVEYRKVVGERDALKAKVEALSKELQEAKRQVEVAAKSDEVIKDLQGKVDAAILSNNILSEDKEKLKKALAQQTEFLKKSEERAAQTEKSLVEAEKKLAEESEGRRVAETRVAGALDALRGEVAPARAAAPRAPAEKPVSEMATRPMKAATPEAAAGPAKAEEQKATKPPEGSDAKPGNPPRPPGRFSFLKK
jgi:hypothetical protein